MARYALWPFGWAVVQSPTRLKALSVVGNVLWFVLAGWWLALGHLLTGPFGRTVLRARELNAAMVGAESTIAVPD